MRTDRLTRLGAALRLSQALSLALMALPLAPAAVHASRVGGVPGVDGPAGSASVAGPIERQASGSASTTGVITLAGPNVPVSDTLSSPQPNETTTGATYNPATHDFMVAWHDGNIDGVGVRVMNPDGTPVDIQRIVSNAADATHSNRLGGAVVARGSFGYTGVWSSGFFPVGITRPNDVTGRGLSPIGLAQGGEAAITTVGDDINQGAPALGTNGLQSLAVWTQEDPIRTVAGGLQDAIFGRMVDGSALPVGGQFVVANPPAKGIQDISPAIAFDAVSNQYLVAWTQRSFLTNPNTFKIQAARLNPSGGALSGVFDVVSSGAEVGEPSILARPGAGGWVVSWTDSRNPATAKDIMARTVSATNALGPEMVVSNQPGGETTPSLAPGNDYYVATWTRGGSGGTGGVFARVLNGNLSPISAEVKINDTPASFGNRPLVLGGAAPDHFMLFWSDDRFSPGSFRMKVYAQPFDVALAVTAAATTTGLTSTPNPSPAGQGVTFTASVTSGGNPVTEGTITFKEGTTTLNGPISVNGSGQVSFTTNALPSGPHTITAEYSGTVNFSASSGSVNQTVDAPLAPVITSISAATCASSGPLNITCPTEQFHDISINGSGFTAPVSTNITGDVQCSPNRVSDSLVVCMFTSTFTGQTATLTVVTGTGPSNPAFITFLAPPPVVTSVSGGGCTPAGNSLVDCPPAGGVTVSVTGNHFGGATAPVSIGNGLAIGAVQHAPGGAQAANTGLTFTLAPGQPGSAAPVVVTASGGASSPVGAPTITYQAPPAPLLSINNTSVLEGNSGSTPAVFTVTLSNPGTQPVTVDFVTRDGTAQESLDYTSAFGTLTFAPGQTSQQVTVPVTGDLLNEPDETFTVELSNPNGASIAVGVGTGTILNDDSARPSISINSIAVTEGNGGTTPATFTVALSSPSASQVDVTVSTGDGSAVAGADYLDGIGHLVFLPGQVSQNVTVAVIGDLVTEPDETFTVTLSNPVNATIDNGVGTATIVNDDPAPTININGVTVTEGNSGTTPATFTVTLSNPSAAPVSVQFSTADGTANAGSDYAATAGTINFAPGETTKSITVLVNGDVLSELDETFTVTLANSTNAAIGVATATGTIVNDDAVSISIGNATVTEGNSGITPANFTVTLSSPSQQTVTVQYATNDGTGKAGTDYVGNAGTLTFTPGEVSKTVTVLIAGDVLNEPDETFTVTLAIPTNAVIANGVGTGTIVNDDGTPIISIDNPSFAEGNSGTTPAAFTVSLSNPSSSPVTVQFATSDGTAAAGSDYAATMGTLTFTPGQTSQSITVLVNGDLVTEPDETFTVGLTSPVNATLGTGTATGTIVNDDAVPSVSINNVSVTEGNSGGTAAVFGVSLTGPSSSPVTVTFATADGTAQAGSDYQASNGALTFAPGEVGKSIVVVVNGDQAVEANETFTVTLSNPVNGTIGNGTGTGTIQNDDAEFTLSVTKLGAGSGTVFSDDHAIGCGSGCSANYPAGSQVTLFATPGANSAFAGWGGACTGTGPCTVTMTANRTVTATFSVATPGAAINQLSAAVDSYAATGAVDQATASSLRAKLTAAQAAVSRGNTTAARNQLQAFLNELRAQRGKKVTNAAADDLINQVNGILATL